MEIYVMDADGDNQRNLTKHGGHDLAPAWYTPALAVAPADKTLTAWGWLKRDVPITAVIEGLYLRIRNRFDNRGEKADATEN